jgi:hypothetical protein
VSGTVGALFSTFMIDNFGPLYALIHLPPFFFAGGLAILTL